jgi:hypothetical protein
MIASETLQRGGSYQLWCRIGNRRLREACSSWVLRRSSPLPIADTHPLATLRAGTPETS